MCLHFVSHFEGYSCIWRHDFLLSHIFGGKVAHVASIHLLEHLFTYFHAYVFIRRCLWCFFTVFKAKVTYLKVFPTINMLGNDSSFLWALGIVYKATKRFVANALHEA